MTPTQDEPKLPTAEFFYLEARIDALERQVKALERQIAALERQEGRLA